MGQESPRVIGILAGGGSLPREIARHVTQRGDRVHIVAIAGEAGEDYAPYPATLLGWGKIGGMIAALKGAGVQDLVIIGAVRRPDLFALRPDLGLFRNLPAIMRIVTAGGDDGVLTRVVRFFEEQGFRVAAPGSLAPELLVGEGPLGRVVAPPGADADIALGFDLLRRLGRFDVGQAAVVAGGIVQAIEGPEGTDRMLQRVARRRNSGQLRTTPGVLVKRPKPGQEMRIDMPAIGPQTVQRACEAGLGGIAVLAGSTLVAERDAVVHSADAQGLFIQGFTDTAQVSAAAPATEPDYELQRISGRKPRPRHGSDGRLAAALLDEIAPIHKSRGVVIDNGHVLAVESGEGVVALLDRAGALRQWGAWRLRRGSAMAVLRAPEDVADAIRLGADAGLAGIAVPGERTVAAAAPIREAAGEARRRGLFLAVLVPGEKP
jgi:DUF1009 family protein